MIDLRLGDCLEVMKTIPDGSIDAIITDPPYGTTACKWDSVIDFQLMWGQLNRIIKPNGAIVLFGGQPFTSALISSNYKKYKYNWVWDKQRGSNFATIKKRPFNSFEDICVFYDKQPTYNPQMIDGKPYNRTQSKIGDFKSDMVKNKKNIVTVSDGKRYPLTILSFPMVGQTNKFHNTQKPILLMEYLIKTYTNENETVLDFTMGSGSTGVAAKNLNRNFIGIEQDQQYFDIATERINKKPIQIVLTL
jgi:site-specific DNA-methyltransferase (adenine-specific)